MFNLFYFQKPAIGMHKKCARRPLQVVTANGRYDIFKRAYYSYVLLPFSYYYLLCLILLKTGF